jgi:hypothetical protein
MAERAQIEGWEAARRYLLGALLGIVIFVIGPETARWIHGGAFTGPNQPPETEAHGTLVPANDPLPAAPCPAARPTVQGWLTILLGPASVRAKDDTKLTILRIGDRNAITMAKGETGITINADVFDENGALEARIEDNEYRVIPGRTSYSKRPDRSTLVVYDVRGDELLWIRYLNSEAVKFRGVFHMIGDPTPIVVADDHMVLGSARLHIPFVPEGVPFAPCMLIVPNFATPIFWIY